MREYWRKNKAKKQAYNKRYWLANREREIARGKANYLANRDARLSYMQGWRLKTLWGLSQADYDTMLEQQEGVCFLCKQKNRYKTAHVKLAVDHDHCTGKIRGLLCNRCNLCLGWFEDLRPQILEYLKRGL